MCENRRSDNSQRPTLRVIGRESKEMLIDSRTSSARASSVSSIRLNLASLVPKYGVLRNADFGPEAALAPRRTSDRFQAQGNGMDSSSHARHLGAKLGLSISSCREEGVRYEA